MIYLIFHGGLGNQLFQYAFGRALQEKYDEKVIYSFNSNIAGDPRELSIEHFKIPDSWDRAEDDYDIWKRNKTKEIALKVIRKIGRFIDHNKNNSEEYGIAYKIESHVLNRLGIYTHYLHRYPKITNAWTSNIIVDGLWNDPKYFLDMQAVIAEELVLREHLSDENQKIMDSICRCNSVCVHVRRGDYVYVPGYLVCTPYYYEKAMEQVKKDEDKPIFYVFSDDIVWCKENISWPDDTIYIDKKNSDYIDFSLMKSCKHFIISNSTFSWWAAFLGRYSEKKVYIPDRWYNDCKTKDSMMLSGWEKIPTVIDEELK